MASQAFIDALRDAGRKATPVDKKLKGEEKLFSENLSQEEMDKSGIIKRSVLPAISKALDIWGRLGQGSLAVIQETGHKLQELSSMSLSDIKEGVLKKEDYNKHELTDAWLEGFKGKRKTSGREIIEEFFPNFSEKQNENTHFKLFGVDGWDVDANTALGLALDVGLDPTTYIPFGAVTKGAKFLKSTSVDLAIDAGKKINPAATEKTLDVLSKVEDKISKSMNFERIFEKYIGETATYQRARRAIGGSGAAVGKYINKQLRNLGIKSEDASIELYKQSQLLSDNLQDILTDDYAKKLGVKVDDIIKFKDAKKTINYIREIESDGELAKTLGEGKVKELQDAYSTLSSYTEDLKKGTSPEVVRLMMEQAGLKRSSNKIASLEKTLNTGMANMEQSFLVQHADTELKSIKVQKKELGKMLNGDLSVGKKLLNEEISGIKNNLNSLNKKLRDDILNKGEADIGDIKDYFGYLDKKLKSLNKYQLGEIKKVESKTLMSNIASKDIGSQSLRQMKSVINVMISDINKGNTKLTKQLRQDLIGKINSADRFLQKELDTFMVESASNLEKLKASKISIDAVNSDSINLFREGMDDLVKREKDLLGIKSKAKIEFANKMRDFDKIEKLRAKRIHRDLQSIQIGTTNDEVLRDFMKRESALEEKYISQNVPKHLQDAVREVRPYFRQKGQEMFEKGLSGYIPGYFPTAIVSEDIGKVSLAVEKGVSTGRSISKTRELLTEESRQKFAKQKGIEWEQDANVLISQYAQKVEMLLAKDALEKQTIAKFGIKNMADDSFTNAKSREEFIKVKEIISKMYGKEQNGFINKIISNIVVKPMNFMLTAANPRYHVVNAISQPELVSRGAGVMSALNPNNWVDSIRTVVNPNHTLERTVAGKTEKIIGKEFEKKLSERGLTAGGQTSTELGMLGMNRNMVYKRYAKTDPKRWVSEYATFSQNVDDIGRRTSVIGLWKQGKTLDEAIDITEKTMLDYNLTNSPFDKSMNGILGFYTYTRRNVPSAIVDVLNNPRKYSMLGKIVSKMSNHEGLTDDELEHLNIYDRSALQFVGETVNGVRQVWQINSLPTSDAYQAINVISSGDLKGLSGRIKPHILTFLDIIYGSELGTGNDIPNRLPAKYTSSIGKSQILMDALHLKKVSQEKIENGVSVGTEQVLTGPKISIVAIRRIPYWSRQINEISDALSKVDEGKRMEAALGYFMGLNQKKLDPEKNKYFDEMTIKDQRRELLKEKGAKQFKGPVYFPKTEEEKSKKKRRRF